MLRFARALPFLVIFLIGGAVYELWRGRSGGVIGQATSTMLRVLRVFLLVVIAYMMLAFVIAFVRPGAGLVERAALVVGVVVLFWAAVPIWRMGIGASARRD